MSRTTGPRRRGHAECDRIGAKNRPRAAERGDAARRGGRVHADEVRLGDHLHVIGAAPAHPAVGDTHHRDSAGLRFLDRGPGRAVHDQHPDIVAAIVERRDFCLAQHLHRIARPLEAPVLWDVEEFRQPRILVAAQRRIDRVIRDDPRLLGVVADAAQCALGMLARFCDSQMNAIGRHPVRPVTLPPDAASAPGASAAPACGRQWFRRAGAAACGPAQRGNEPYLPTGRLRRAP